MLRSRLRRPLAMTTVRVLALISSACFLVDENDNPRAVGQCVERAGARAEYPGAETYGGDGKGVTGVLVARFPQGTAVLLFGAPGRRPQPPSGQPARYAVGGRVAYWWHIPGDQTEVAALNHCLDTPHS